MNSNLGKKCECGHYKSEHIWIEKTVSKIAFLGEGFLRMPQEGRGLCRRCTCPKYHPPSFFRSRREMEYVPREIKNNPDGKKRCRTCGRLLEDHIESNHRFREL